MSGFKKVTIPVKSMCNLFLCKTSEATWLGYRKRITSQSRYSILEKEMLKGKVIRCEEVANGITFILSEPEDEEWRAGVFDLSDDLAIHFPWPPVDCGGNELICPDAYWDNISQKPLELDDEERHFREHSVKVLKDIVFEGCHIYDPACSTGRFLSYIAEHFNGCRYSASDRSEKMVALARSVLPDAFVCDITNADTEKRYDIIFCRFVNHEVVEQKEAEPLLLSLFARLHDEGHLVIFGHTPISCDVRQFAVANGIEIKMQTGRSRNPEGLFQYYILQKRPAS